MDTSPRAQLGSHSSKSHQYSVWNPEGPLPVLYSHFSVILGLLYPLILLSSKELSPLPLETPFYGRQVVPHA